MYFIVRKKILTFFSEYDKIAKNKQIQSVFCGNYRTF